MQCKSPPLIESLGHRVRCGRCLACRVKFRDAWATRIRMESYSHYHRTGLWAQFLTFTYRTENVPLTVDGEVTLRKRRFQNWLKNEQKILGKFRYFAVGEYGSKLGRPHYHMVIFPENPKQAGLLCARWEEKYGFTSQYPVTDGAWRYITKYATKYLSRTQDQEKLGQKELEFRVSSRRPVLGADFGSLLLQRLGKAGKTYWFEKVGDVPRSFRVEGVVYPIPKAILQKMRKTAGIPLTTVGRRDRCPTYDEYLEEGGIIEWDPETAKNQEIHYRAKEKKIAQSYGSQAL